MTDNVGMTDDELKAIIAAGVKTCIGFQSGDAVSDLREKLMDYYLGEPFGNEVEGRSQVVSTDVSDVVESLMPTLMKIFTSGEEVVKFEPVGEEDQQQADQATDYVNHVFNKENEGFKILYTWIKDALLQVNGVVKRYWKVEEKITTDRYTGLSFGQVAALLEDGGEPVAADAYVVVDGAKQPVDPAVAQAMPEALYDVAIRSKKKMGRVCIENIAPEYFLISSGSRSLEDAYIKGDYCYKTKTQMIEEGIDPELLDGVQFASGSPTLSAEEQSRFDEEGDLPGQRNTLDDTMRPIVVTTLALRVDYDGDGVAELRQVLMAGGRPGEGKLLSNEEIDEAPYDTVTGILMPHRWLGRAVAELAMDIQLVKSTIQRQILDNLYLTNNSRHVYLTGAVNLDDLLTSRPGGVIGVEKLDAVKPLDVQPISQSAFAFLEYEDSVRETRTGVTRYNQGLDADSLNSTATGISRIMDASMDRVELIARIIAETGVKRLFKAVLRLVIKHQDKAKTVRLRNEWVEVDPRYWNAEMDVTVNVGIGTGGKEAKSAMLMQLLQTQMQVAMPLGITEPAKIYNTLARLVENLGLKSAEAYFVDPVKKQQEMQQLAAQGMLPPQPPSPEQQQMEAEQKKAEAQLQLEQKKAEADFALQKYKIDTEAALKAQTEQVRMNGQVEMSKHTAETASKPAAQFYLNSDDAAGKVTQQLQQGIQAGNEQVVQAVQQGLVAVLQAVQQGNQQLLAAVAAPKEVVLDNGRKATITPQLGG
jgi:hypothetical protein